MPNEIDGNPQPFLEGLVGQLSGKRFVLSGPRVVLGRDASQCQIVLSQAVISKVHAALEVDDLLRVTLVELSNKQATFVNGEPISRCQLRHGDRIGLGPAGVVAFLFHAALPGVEYRDVRSDGKDRIVSRFVISTPSEPPPEVALESRPYQRFETAPPQQFEQPPSAIPSAPKRPAGTTILRAAQIPVIRLGRANDNNFVLDAPSVSRYHAVLSYENGAQPILTDLGSTNGTFVNGQLISEPRQLTPQDLVFIGGFLLHVDGRNIRQHDLSASSITARNLTKQIDQKIILKDVSIALAPREFVGLMGPSGCGKSTLMDALNGLRPASAGQVLVNDLDLYSNFNSLRRSIGYVPQRDILHEALTVERTLHYVARLRLPRGTSAETMSGIVNEVIETVGLTEHRRTQFKLLSGGQQKRLSLAFELITKPSFLFLDEPTSPLDPETTEKMMELFRRLADDGRIVVMVTHKFEKFYEMHHIAMLTKGGRLAYFGPPGAALEYFHCKEPGEIFRYVGSHDPDELSERFRKSSNYQRYIHARITESDQLSQTSGALQIARPINQTDPERRVGLSQWLTLTRRYLEVKLKDKRNTLLLLAQAPIVAILLAIIVGQSINGSQTLFIAAIVSIWFGANNAVREIVSESAIYARERLVNLKIPSYVFSKFTVLSGIALFQCLLFVAILIGMGRLRIDDLLSLILILYLTSLAGIATGLFFSALVNSTEKAMSVLPLVLIPQLLLSGYIKPVEDVYFTQSYKPASEQQYERFRETQDANRPIQTPPGSPPARPVELISKTDGMGMARYAAALMIARWTMDALAHNVSIEDKEARDKLAASITVREYERVFEGKTDDEIASAYRTRVLLDCGVLTLFSILFLAMTMWALKRKDVL